MRYGLDRRIPRPGKPAKLRGTYRLRFGLPQRCWRSVSTIRGSSSLTEISLRRQSRGSVCSWTPSATTRTVVVATSKKSVKPRVLNSSIYRYRINYRNGNVWILSVLARRGVFTVFILNYKKCRWLAPAGGHLVFLLLISENRKQYQIVSCRNISRADK